MRGTCPESGNVADAELVSRSDKNNTTCEVDTDKAGVWYYFCKIVNTLGESHTSANTQMIRVEVKPKAEPADRNCRAHAVGFERNL